MLLCLMRWCPVGRQDYCCSLTPVATQFGCWGWRCCGEGDEPSHCMAMVRGLHFLQPARMEQSLYLEGSSVGFGVSPAVAGTEFWVLTRGGMV